MQPILQMMRRRRGKHEATGPCRHWRKTVATNSGLQFVFCHICKHVSVRYLHAVLEDDIELPEGEYSISKTG
ncbi:MAG: hypothetical protein L0Z49_06205 [Actinobacteria bacterium]|nr:hypothetical protein [Actinomycetota bacterium]MCI0544025.1 hypothetical protein [Actinomycetota bacterium]